ncbi:uncharacterized protein [Musca autumnalis]|uniref:uncharacterized protein n=1 Tax=Musca autumnalis TaxID=221902 RepID=UPI003CFA649C
MLRPVASCRIFVCYILLSLCVLSKCGFEINVDSEKFKDHDANIVRVQEVVDGLNYDINELETFSNKQYKALAEMKAVNNLSPLDTDDTCERITLFFNSTQRKYNVVEERIILKLQEINDEQMENLKLIMNQRNCHTAAAALLSAPLVESVTPEIITDFKEKLTNLERELQQYEERQKSLQQKNEQQLKILRNINAELSGHNAELENFEKQLSPMIQNAIEVVRNSKDHGKVDTLPLDMVVGLTTKCKESLRK